MKKIVLFLYLSSWFFSANSSEWSDAKSLFSTTQTTITQTTIQKDPIFPFVYYNTRFLTENFNAPRLTKALIVWDLNGVIFRKEHSITANLYQIAVTEGRGWIATFKILASFGKLWAHKLYLKNHDDPRGFVWDAMFCTLETPEAGKAGKQFAALLRRFSQQANVLDYNTVALMQELSNNGHENVILSNMGQGLANVNINFLRRQLDKNILSPEQQEAIRFALHVLTDTQHNVIASAENNWLHKPMRESYETCLNKNKLSSAEHCLTIFIDDKLSNVVAAVEDELFDIAIHFTTPQDLRMFFVQLGHDKLVIG